MVLADRAPEVNLAMRAWPPFHPALAAGIVSRSRTTRERSTETIMRFILAFILSAVLPALSLGGQAAVSHEAGPVGRVESGRVRGVTQDETVDSHACEVS